MLVGRVDDLTMLSFFPIDSTRHYVASSRCVRREAISKENKPRHTLAGLNPALTKAIVH